MSISYAKAPYPMQLYELGALIHPYDTLCHTHSNMDHSQPNHSFKSHPPTFPGVKFRSHIQVKVERLSRDLLILPFVEINQVFHSRATPIYNPIVPVKRRRVA
jgi:hypothetical protein